MKFNVSNQKEALEKGGDLQSSVWMEECGELIQAISKINRYGIEDEYKFNLIEEISDVIICIEQMCEKYDIYPDHIQSMINYKCKRNKERLEDGIK